MVYDMEQAFYLGKFLEDHDLAIPMFEFEEGVGIANLGPMKAGRPAQKISPDRSAPRTAAERKRNQRERAKLLKP